MTLLWHRKDMFMTAGERKIECWSKVRNELNKLRPIPGQHDICISSDGQPVMPRPFPSGTWRITGFKEHPDPKWNSGYLYPVFIATDAFNILDVWELDDQGFYLRPAYKTTRDYANGLHFSTSAYSHGCLRIAKEDDVRWLWKTLVPGEDKIIVTEG